MRVTEEVSADKAWEHAEWLCKEAPERLSGSPAASKVDDYLAARLSDYGLEVKVHELDALLSFPEPAGLEVLSPERVVMAGRAKAQSATTPPGGLEGELVYVGQGAVQDYDGVDVAGRIVLAELSSSPHRPEKMRIAIARGAAALVIMNWGLPGQGPVPYGTVKPVWGSPTPEDAKLMSSILPAMGLDRADGERLRAMAAAGLVRVRMHSRASREWLKVRQVTGWVPGTEEPEKFILVGGHVDAWGGGTTCNAAGNAVTLELARGFSRLRGQLKRSVLFAFWMGHETGQMAGSTWFVDNYWEELRDNCLLYINIDSPGMIGTLRTITWAAPETVDFHSRVEEAILGAPAERGRLRKTGDQSFWGVGVPAIGPRTIHTAEQSAQWNGAGLGWWYHSDHDTLDKADRALIGVALKRCAAYVEDIANRPVLPFNFVPMAEAFAGRLAELQQEAGDSFDLSVARAKAARLRERATLLEAARAELAASEQEGSGRWPSDRARALNATLMKLSRTLTPTLMTVAGKYDQDSYGWYILRKYLPGLYELGRFAALKPEDEERRLLLTKLVRERNRVVDALDEASWLIDVTLERLGA